MTDLADAIENRPARQLTEDGDGFDSQDPGGDGAQQSVS